MKKYDVLLNTLYLGYTKYLLKLADKVCLYII